MYDLDLLKNIYFSKGDVKFIEYLKQHGGCIYRMKDTELQKELGLTGISVRIRHLASIGVIISKIVKGGENNKYGRDRIIYYQPEIMGEIITTVRTTDLTRIRFNDTDVNLILYLYTHPDHIKKRSNLKYAKITGTYLALKLAFNRLKELQLINNKTGYYNVDMDKVMHLIEITNRRK